MFTSSCTGSRNVKVVDRLHRVYHSADPAPLRPNTHFTFQAFNSGRLSGRNLAETHFADQSAGAICDGRFPETARTYLVRYHEINDLIMTKNHLYLKINMECKNAEEMDL